jgi:hypothetical protein
VDVGLVDFGRVLASETESLKAINKMQVANDVELDSAVFQVSSADNR